MTEAMEIKSAFKTYQVRIVDTIGGFKQMNALPNSFFVIDKNVYRLYEELFRDIPEERLYLLDPIEEKKTIKTALAICERMMLLDAKRNSVLISFGGGITQDITGFAASILYRGIRWIFVPTTLLAASDSCIGGKTSLNYKKYKNLLGTFFPPDEIYICPSFFSTLDRRDYLSGLGEVVKFNIIQNEQVLDALEKAMPALLSKDPETVNRFVVSSLEFKRAFIEADEFDRGKRIHLNFAHTFGHAYEVASSYRIPHGTAVAMGTVTANYISVERGVMMRSQAKRIESLIQDIIDIEIDAGQLNLDTILAAIHKDKKQTNKQITAVLMDKDFLLSVVHDVTTEEVKNAVLHLLEFLHRS